MGWDRADDARTRTTAESARVDHDGQTSGVLIERTRGKLRYRGNERAVAAIVSHRALARGAEIRG
jgi:hypothetical protein